MFQNMYGKLKEIQCMEYFCHLYALDTFIHNRYLEVNTYIVRSYRDVIVVTNIVKRRTSKA